MWKKLLSLNLALIMILTMLPISAFAAEAASRSAAEEKLNTWVTTVETNLVYDPSEQRTAAALPALPDGFAWKADISDEPIWNVGDYEFDVVETASGEIYTVTLIVRALNQYETVISFYPNDGTNTVEKRVFYCNYNTSGESLVLYQSVPDFEREGHVLTSYNTKKDGTGSDLLWVDGFFANGKDALVGKTELYAQWAKVSGSYIRYICNGRSVFQDGFDLGDRATLLGADTFSSGDQSVVYWTDEEDNVYYPGQTVKLTEDLVLYAYMGYPVKVDLGDGAIYVSGIQEHIASDGSLVPFSVKLPALEREG